MSIPPVDLAYLRDQFRELADQIHELRESGAGAPDTADTPKLLRDAMTQLADVLLRLQEDQPGEDQLPGEIDTLGEYGLHLFESMAGQAREQQQAKLAHKVERLALSFALWIGRRGGELRNLTPVVNALAEIANQAAHPQAMAEMYSCCCEVIEAASPMCEENCTTDARHPWRLLLLNRAIVATRSHNPELMAVAFDAIVEYLPAEASAFFAEGMEQMAIIDYPDHVRDLMHHYYVTHAAPRRLH